MATIITDIASSKVLSNLDTYNHTAALNAMYKVSIQVSETPISGLSVVIQQNGSTKATAAAPAASQSHIELQTVLNCAVNDVISVILSSSTPEDQKLNRVKAILSIDAGLST